MGSYDYETEYDILNYSSDFTDMSSDTETSNWPKLDIFPSHMYWNIMCKNTWLQSPLGTFIVYSFCLEDDISINAI